MIKGIVFDIPEVLLNGLLGTEKYLNKKYGLQITEDDWVINEFEMLFHGKITEEQYFQALIEKYKWNIPIQKLKKAVRNNFKEIKGTRQIIQELKHRDYKLGLLSVHAKEWVEYCEEKYGYHKLFDSILYSFEVAMSKPNIKIYELILSKLEINPSECVFIDDKIRNIKAAGQLGIKTIQFKNHIILRKNLRSLRLKLNN
ncbi:HAD family phosphatase [Candidatus Roizmanbacteria bacterium]|nr:HAD family phosphatase [Candidatus Roizmanbacteria bacterium]